MTYRIVNTISGLDLGEYDAPSSDAALDMLAQDAGYENHHAACTVAPVQAGELVVIAPDGSRWPSSGSENPSPMTRPLSERVAELDAVKRADLLAAWSLLWLEVPDSDRKEAVTECVKDYTAPTTRQGFRNVGDPGTRRLLVEALLKLSIWLEGYEAGLRRAGAP